MTEASARPARARLLLNVALAGACAFAGGVAGWLWQSHRLAADPAGSLSAGDRAAVEKVVEGYLMAHPEVLPRAMAELDKKQGHDQLAAVRADVERAAMGTVLGNPTGKITLVEFTDYACTYCRGSVADVDRLIAINPDLRVVVRELPILTPASTDAAKWAIAAAAQGRYARFHAAMFETGRPSAETIAAAAQSAGLDLAAAQKVVADPATEAELVRNLDLAKKLGFTGTPSWVVGDTIIAGAVGADKLAEAIADART
jgi:protein-disulfide isomerase